VTVERLKGSVTVGRTVQLRPFDIFKLEYTEEFFLGENNLEDKAEALLARLDAKIGKERMDRLNEVRH
jgi:hypothetical protein